MYRYRVSVESLTSDNQQPRLEFEVDNHDDITAAAARIAGKLDLDHNATLAFVVGMKLFGETILKNRHDPLFQSIKPAFMEFMSNLKGRL